MNVRPSLRIVILLMAQAGRTGMSAEDLVGTIRLRAEGEITGRVVEADTPSLGLRPYWTDETLTIPLGEILSFRQESAESRIVKEGGVVEFRNGDRLQLRRAGYDGEIFTGTTAWEGEVRIPRGEVQRMRFYHPENLIYAGPEFPVLLGGDERDWQTGGLAWPDQFLLEARVEKTSDEFAYQVVLFENQDMPRRNPAERLLLDFSPKMISAHWLKMTGHNRFSAKNWRESFSPEGRTDLIRLRGDLPNQRFTLSVNGRRIQSWQVDLQDLGRAGVLYPLKVTFTSHGEIRLNSLRILGWVEASDTDQATRAEPPADRLFFRGEAPLPGTLAGMDAQGVQWLESGRDRPRLYPWRDVTMIELSPPSGTADQAALSSTARIHTVGSEDLLNLPLRSVSGSRLIAEAWGQPFAIPLRAIRAFELSGENP